MGVLFPQEYGLRGGKETHLYATIHSILTRQGWRLELEGQKRKKKKRNTLYPVLVDSLECDGTYHAQYRKFRCNWFQLPKKKNSIPTSRIPATFHISQSTSPTEFLISIKYFLYTFHVDSMSHELQNCFVHDTQENREKNIKKKWSKEIYLRRSRRVTSGVDLDHQSKRMRMTSVHLSDEVPSGTAMEYRVLVVNGVYKCQLKNDRKKSNIN